MQARFFYDIVCPYAYLASTQIEQLALETGTKIEWVPMLLGGVFRSIGAPQVPALQMSPAKARMNNLDLERWSQRWQVPFSFSKYHPQRSVEAMRLLCLTPQTLQAKVSRRIFEAYWAEQKRLDQTLLESIAHEFGLLELWQDQAQKAKAKLFENTELAVSFGVFGAPALEVDGQIFWGQDRLDIARTALGHKPKEIAQGEAPRGSYVEVFHDFSSPFSYLGCQHLEKLVTERGAQVVWRPMLLGALFKSIGAPNVPLFAMNKPKQKYMGKDLQDWAKYWDVPFKFPQAFPLRTVQALRLSIIEPKLTQALYQEAWVQGHDLGDEEVLSRVLTDHGYDAEVYLEQTQTQSIKDQLRTNTEEAKDKGAFGAPSFILHRPDEATQLFWGQDRLTLLCEALIKKSLEVKMT